MYVCWRVLQQTFGPAGLIVPLQLIALLIWTQTNVQNLGADTTWDHTDLDSNTSGNLLIQANVFSDF